MKPFPSLIVVMLLSLPALQSGSAQSPVVQLTEDPAVPLIPDSVRIQSASTGTNGTTLAVWGTTTQVDADRVKPDLVYQFIESTGVIGSPRVLSSEGAHPSRRVLTHPYLDRFLVFWHDSRPAGAAGVWLRVISRNSGVLSDEIFLATGDLVKIDPVIGTDSTPLHLFVTTTSGTYLYSFDTRGLPDTPPRRFGSAIYDQHRLPGSPWEGLVRFSDSSALLYEESASGGRFHLVPPARMFRSFIVEADSSLWVQEGNVVRQYDHPWEDSATRTLVLEPDCNATGALFFGGYVDSVVRVYTAITRYDTLFLHNENDRRYSASLGEYQVTRDGVDCDFDTVHLATCPKSNYYSGGHHIITSCDLVRFTITNEPGLLPFIEVAYDYSSSVGNVDTRSEIRGRRWIDPMTGELRNVPTGNDSIAPERAVRISAGTGSAIRVETSTSDDTLIAEAAAHHPRIPIRNLALFVRDSAVAVVVRHAVADTSAGRYLPGEIRYLQKGNLSPIDTSVGGALPTELFQYSKPWGHGEFIESRAETSVATMTRGPFVASYTNLMRVDRYEQVVDGDDPPLYPTKGYYTGIHTSRGFSYLPDTIGTDWELGFYWQEGQFTEPVFAWDPNSGYLFVQTARSVGYGRDRECRVGAIDTAGVLHWANTLASYPGAIAVVIDSAQWIVSRFSKLYHYPSERQIVLQSGDLEEQQFQRLFGDRFLRHGRTAEGHRLEIYSLDAAPVVSHDLDQTEVQHVTFGTTDSSIAVLSVSGPRIEVRVFNQNLESADPPLLSVDLPEMGAISKVRGAIADRVLYLAWAGTDSEEGREEAYVTRIGMPVVPSITTGTGQVAGDTSRSSDTTLIPDGTNPDPHTIDQFSNVPLITRYGETVSLKFYPNPTTGSVVVPLRLTLQLKVVISISDELGRVVAVRDFDGTAGENRLDLDLSEFEVGTYLIRLQAGTGRGFGKVQLIGRN